MMRCNVEIPRSPPVRTLYIHSDQPQIRTAESRLQMPHLLFVQFIPALVDYLKPSGSPRIPHKNDLPCVTLPW